MEETENYTLKELNDIFEYESLVPKILADGLRALRENALLGGLLLPPPEGKDPMGLSERVDWLFEPIADLMLDAIDWVEERLPTVPWHPPLDWE